MNYKKYVRINLYRKTMLKFYVTWSLQMTTVKMYILLKNSLKYILQEIIILLYETVFLSCSFV